jgi:hypothetical protein
VQTSGRVNRHRNIAVAKPNIALLQYNWLAVRNAKKPPMKNEEKTVFIHPGFEIGDSHRSHDLSELLDWFGLHAVDAGLMFDEHRHRFALWDNSSIQKSLEKVMSRLFDADKAEPFWVNQGIYEEYSLRDKTPRIEARLNADGDYEILKPVSRKPSVWVKWEGAVEPVPKLENDWLSLPPEELFEVCRDLGVALEQGMRFSVGRDSFSFDPSFGAH